MSDRLWAVVAILLCVVGGIPLAIYTLGSAYNQARIGP